MFYTSLKAKIYNTVFWLVVVGWLVFGVSRVWAQQMLDTIPSTPDISLANKATAEVAFQKGVTWIYIKNDCAAPVYFDLKAQRTKNSYPLRLNQGEAFSGFFPVNTLGVSPGAGASSCTITVIPARK